ncbi:pectin lyase-like protein [Penicillium angulare]|uniref:pectin lyase-like protein n=1 Tax=Penicillium angulare TaxID=116970 RepID=UPI0025420254|nr:pectin lyase-like protein [Penicillium angulare]KAJ5288608.1 pectin lyase-like protein [Penicillium angulare]
MHFKYLSLLALALLQPVHSFAIQSRSTSTQTRTQCQKHLNCPKDTLFVSPTDPRASHKTIQSAISSLPNDKSSQTILVFEGSYNEQLNVTRPGPITILGQSDSPSDPLKNKVTVSFAAANQDSTGTIDNVWFSVLVVAPTLDASLIGSGTTGFAVPDDTPFGNTDFRVYNVDFVNDFAPYTDGPAAAMMISRANGGFYYCGFYSYQDTIYVGKLGNAYFYKSIIAGETDFLYGFGTAWIQSSDIQLRGCGGGITAWKGTNTTFENKYGVYIVDSNVAAANSSVAPSIKGKCALGRPWNALHRSIFANTYEDGSILPAGYIQWDDRYEDGSTLMAEYEAFGPGFNKTARVDGGYDTLLSKKGYQTYSTPEVVFQDQEGKLGYVDWIDWETVGGK